MRKVSWFCAFAAVALASAGVAVAHGGFGARSATAVAGTFTATQVGSTKTTTCTNADGTWTRVDATYTGTAAGDAALTGPAKLEVHALINTTKNLGVVSGSLRIDTAGEDTKARFSTVYAGGKVAGLAEGRAQDPRAQLVANVSASYSPTAGFTNGKIGGGTEGGTALALAAGSCERQAEEKATLVVHGAVVSVSSSALVLKSGSDQVSCAVDAALAADVAKLAAGQAVTAKCALAGGSYRLVALGKAAEKHGSRNR